MSELIQFLEALLPACITFGPLFLVVPAKNVKYERAIRYMGVAMVVAALASSWFATSAHKRRITVLEQRLHELETPPR